MPVDQKQCRIVFQKLDRQLSKVTKTQDHGSIHKFRTYGRRVETLLMALAPEPSRNNKKLLKMLARLRKKAGRMRDLDVQMSNLRNLKIAKETGQKSRLLRSLAEERAKQQKKLAHAFDKETVRELHKRLKRAANDLEIQQGAESFPATMREVAHLERAHAPLTEKTLHHYRIEGKRARYLAELAGKDPQAERVVEQLKRMQDAIGDWHDWWKLTQRAEELFGGVRDSALVAALRNLTRAKFRQGVDAVVEIRSTIREKKPLKMEIAENRKPPTLQSDRLSASVA